MNPGYVVIDGTTIRFFTSTPFTNLNGIVADPTEVIFAYQINDGTSYQVIYGTPQSWGTIVKVSTGNYYVDLDTTGKPGIWTYTWVGIGSVQTRSENQLVVASPNVTVTP